MMWIQIRARGVRGHVSLENGAIWRVLSVLKYVIITLKSNNFKDNKSTIVKIINHVFQQCQSRLACYDESKYI